MCAIMSGTSDIFLNKCRICLSDCQHQRNSFFDSFCDGYSLAEILRNISSVQEVVKDGIMPEYVCTNCTTTILNFKNLLKVFHESEQYFRETICKNENFLSQVKYPLVEDIDVEEKSSYASNDDDFRDADDTEDEVDKCLYKPVAPNKEEDKLNVKSEEVTTEDTVVSQPDHELVTTTKYNCEICGDCFLFKSGFSHHMLMVHRVCIQVNQYEQYSSSIEIKVPKANSENEIKIPKKLPSVSVERLNDFQCKKCKDKFETAHELKKHSEIHKTFRCDQCGAAFIKNSYLRDHLLKHSTDKCYSCKICGQAFKYRSALAVHRRDHSGTHRGHMCETCGRSFKERGTLKTHIMLKHSNERNFPCTGCGLTFKLKAARDKHYLRKHTNNRTKDFVCSMCGMAYLNKETLTRHMNDKHTDVPVSHWCTVCEKSFTMKSNLFKHLRNKHNVITRNE